MLTVKHTKKKLIKYAKDFEKVVYDTYCIYILAKYPMGEVQQVPYRRTMFKLLSTKLNPDNDEFLNLIIKNFVDKTYDRIGAK